MDLLAIRERLAEQIRDSTGLPVHELPSSVQATPAVLLGPPSGRYDQDFGGSVALQWPLVVVVSRSHPDTLSALAFILSTDGVDDRSIVDAINASTPYPDASFWRVTDWEPWSDLDIGTVSYWSATVNIEIHV